MNKELVALRIAGVPEHFNLPWMLALERRSFVRAGVDLRWSTVPEGTGRMCQMLRNGEVDLAVLVTEGAVRDILLGNPSRVVSNYVDTPLIWGVHVGAHTPITKPAELKGRPFAISRINSGSHLAAVVYAQANGWTPKESDFVVVNDLKGAEECLTGRQPVAFLWEKFTTKHLVDAGLLRRVDEYRSSWPSFVIVATEAALAEHPKEIARLQKVVRDQAVGLMQKKTAPEMIAQRYKMGLEDAREWLADVRWSADGVFAPESLGAVSNSLVQAGIIEPALARNAESVFLSNEGAYRA